MDLLSRMFIGLTNSGSGQSSNNTWRLSVKVGDLIECDQYGLGVITDVEGRSYAAYFYEVGKKGWFDIHCLGHSMEIISEGR